MSAPFVELGPDARIAVGGQMFGVKSGRFRINGDSVDNSDSESAQNGYRLNVIGLVQMELDITAQRQSDVSYHGPGVNLAPSRGNYVSTQLYPAGLGGAWYDVSMSPQSFTWSHNLDGSQAHEVQISGKSNDLFAYPATG